MLGWELDIGGESVGVEAGCFDEGLSAAGDGFEMDVAVEEVCEAEGSRDLDELLHGVVGRLDDAGGEEETFDVVALVEVESKLDDFFGGEAGAADVGGDAIDAEDAVVSTEIGEEDFEEGDAAAVGRVGVTDAGAIGVADTFSIAGAFGA